MPGWGTTGDILFVSAGGYHHHLGFNTWKSAGGGPQPDGVAGLHHVAIRYPTRAGLADALRRLREVDWPIRQATDHGTHEAIYISDPDGNDLELCWDRPDSGRRPARSTPAPRESSTSTGSPPRREHHAGDRRPTSRRSSRCGSPCTTSTPRRCPSWRPTSATRRRGSRSARSTSGCSRSPTRCCCSRTSTARWSATRSRDVVPVGETWIYDTWRTGERSGSSRRSASCPSTAARGSAARCSTPSTASSRR